EPLEQPEPLDVEALAAFLEPGGPLAQLFPGYEHRPPQVEMLAAVAEAFNHGDHLLIEAGTGTGKSLAYLLPAILWAVQNRRRVVISTNTINLQDQLIDKDVPALVQIFDALATQHRDRIEPRFLRLAEQGRQVRVALLKGRNNYLCPYRLNLMRSRTDLTADELRVLARVLVWLGQTATGDRAELFLPSGRDQAVWARLASESGVCTTERCETKGRGRCFFYRRHQEAEAAHLIVVNHALLLSDVATANRVLPDYRHLIVDEAHHLEEATTSQLGFQTSEEDLERLLRDIHPEGGEGRPGVLMHLQVWAAGLSPQVRQALEPPVRRAAQRCEQAREALRRFFAALTVALDLRRGGVSAYSLRVRLDSKARSQPAWSAVETAWDEAGSPLADLAELLAKLGQGLQELADADVKVPDDLLADLPSLADQVAAVHGQIDAAILHPDREIIYWVEAIGAPPRVSIHSAPLHIGPLVEKHLFHQKENVILTSATLRTGNSYDYIQERLHAFDANTVTVGSPFDYKRSTLVFIPTDLGDPNSPAFQAQVEAAICELAKALGGRTMALFTSNEHLRRTAEAVSRQLQAAGIAVYQQGEGGSRRQLLENFRANARSVLLGTRSFWEGVDVVGEALSGLVIAKLPFAVPTDPVVAARAETFDDPFYQYSVPDAILRFRQGFGRLIRSQTDRGICVILDNRVLTKAYGRLFLESLPECTVQRAPLSALAAAARAWLEQ
ncbi:MAG: helicase C-terminal domain-containing protein, partial [Anaerolineae bacterium]|nr:helicase C-terminal domain-containing protein [Anaerolineae bacterium]